MRSIKVSKRIPSPPAKVWAVLADFPNIYQPKFGLLGQIMGSLALDGQLTKGFKGFLNDLDAASQSVTDP